MKFIPMLFSTPMVQAIREGRKTQTRRVIKESLGWDDEWNPSKVKEQYLDGVQRWEMRNGTKYSIPYFKCPYGQPGGVIWVRETFSTNFNPERNRWDYIYKADGGIWIDDDGPMKWKPSLFMPKEAARIFLKVVNIRVERLRHISEEDAMAEGANEALIDHLGSTWKSYRQGFENLWQSINGAESWDVNPWVWVIDFEVIHKPENFLK